MTDFNLSDKQYNNIGGEDIGAEVYLEEDVKEFIRLLKGYVDNIRDSYGCHDCVIYGQSPDTEAPCWHEFIENISKEIDKLCGEKLK